MILRITVFQVYHRFIPSGEHEAAGEARPLASAKDVIRTTIMVIVIGKIGCLSDITRDSQWRVMSFGLEGMETVQRRKEIVTT